MNKLLIGLLVIGYACLFTSCDKKECAGPTITVTKDLDHYNELELDGSMELEIKSDMTEDIRIIAPDNLQKYIETYVYADRLVIHERDNKIKNGRVRIEISETAITSILLAGSGEVYGDTLKANHISLRIDGSGNIDLPIDCTELQTRISGSGRLKAYGLAESSNAAIDGSGLIDVKNVESASAHTQIDGSGAIDIYANTSIFARIAGSGSIRYWGNPEFVDADVSGSGSIIPIN